MPVVLFVYAVWLFFSLQGEAGGARSRNLHLFSWVPVGGFKVDVGFLLDPLSLTFVLLITGVGSLIHIYAVGYLDHDPGRRRFFGYFNLFIAAMLLLVLANGYLVLYVGWEGVGLASYLLIGYYYTRPSAATAAKKAFIANRVGDVGLSIAIMLMFAYLGSTDFQHVFAGVAGLHPGVITALALMLLLGACGKSGQFPLQTWLPDAMEGPDPGVGADPRGDHGDRRGVPDRPVGADLRPDRGRPHRGHHRRRDHPAVRLCLRVRPGRPEAGAGLLHGQPDRLHVPGGRAWATACTRSASCTWSGTASSRPRCSCRPVR